MSAKYKIGDEVPSEILCKRLRELANAVTKGEKGVRREFYMSIPAQVDHDADLVLSAAAKRIEALEAKLFGAITGEAGEFLKKLDEFEEKSRKKVLMVK